MDTSTGESVAWDAPVTATPLADLRNVRLLAREHSTPFDSPDGIAIKIDVRRHPVHLLSADFIASVTSILEEHGYRVTKEAVPGGGWMVDWERD